jgi:uncharacterized protein (DUF1697 family)
LGRVNKVPMKELARLFEDGGYEQVRTHLQSGNVVFSSRKPAAKLRTEIERAVSKTFGLDVTVMVRNRLQMKRVVDGNPFSTKGGKTSSVHVLFLAGRPRAAAVKSLDPDRSPRDAFEVSGTEIYLHYPNGAGRSKLSTDYNRKGTRDPGDRAELEHGHQGLRTHGMIPAMTVTRPPGKPRDSTRVCHNYGPDEPVGRLACQGGERGH